MSIKMITLEDCKNKPQSQRASKVEMIISREFLKIDASGSNGASQV